MNERRGTKGLELWCRKMTEGYPGVKVENMTTSWRDGLAFCAIIHHFRPDLIDFSKLNKDDVYHNNELAFRVAEQYLGIPALLEPEDMVEYSVPDRLSILTYLSQFYQAFAVREGASSARIAPKRPQVSSDHGIVSPASTSPPTKVALTSAGKLRREPCAKCALPVFIAERLNVGKSLFHRTCFRCARCNSQLTLANYYETENSEFCCEICPDEEKIVSKTSAQKAVLLRSMSDEEKTASLNTFSDEPDEFSALFESALENSDAEKIQTLSTEFDSARADFFNSQIKSSASSDSGTDDKEEEPPDLPKSLPPESATTDSVVSAQTDSVISVETNSLINAPSGTLNSRQYDSAGFSNKDNVGSDLKVTLSSDQESQNVVTKDESSEESLVKTRRRLFENNVTDIKADVNRKTVPLSTFTSIPSSIKNDTDNFSDITEDTPRSKHILSGKGNNGKRPLSERQYPKKQFTSSISLELSAENNNLDKNEQQNVIPYSVRNGAVKKSSVDDNKDTSVISISESRPIVERNKSIDIADCSVINKDTLEENKSSPDNCSNLIDESIQAINDCVEAMKSLEDSSKVITINDETKESDVKLITSDDDSFKLNSLSVASAKDASNLTPSSDADPFVSLQGDQIETIESRNDYLKSYVNKESTETVETVNYDVKDFTESKSEDAVIETVNREVKIPEVKPTEIIVETINYNVQDPLDNSPQVVETVNINVKDNVATKSPPVLEKMESYPGDLNPFGDEDKGTPNQSWNPFGSDDEDDLRPSSEPVASPRFKKKVLDASDFKAVTESPMKDVKIIRISVNPFESDEIEKPVPAVRRKKISILKNNLNPFSSDDDDGEEVAVARNPRLSGSAVDVKPRESGRLLNSSLQFGSNSSISSGSYYGSTRKKRPAPKPPIPGFLDVPNISSLTSTPNHSVQHTPKATPKHRKNRRAPSPPKFTSTPDQSHLNPKYQPQTESSKDDKQQDEIGQEKLDKDEVNRNRQSQNMQNIPLTESVDNGMLNKSTYGKWKRKKGQAPPKPVPPQKRTIKCLPMTEIKKELDFIEIQQQGLERQGVRLEQIIREKCEGSGSTVPTAADDDIPIEVEDLILQLFELVNEKNELFRKQTELMYLRRQQRLEEEHADVEYQIRCLMMQPEANKTDSDKAREEELIKRLLKIVEKRNEIVECLENDRVRENEENDSISNHINLFTLNRENKSQTEKPKKEKDKEKKKHKTEKKSKHKKKDKIDADKDVDTSETVSTLEKKKKKKFNLF